MVDAQLLALRITYLVKESGKNRLTISEAKLKTLASREVLPIPYLADLKQRLEELGCFLGTLEGGYCLLSIESLRGAPSLPMGNDTLRKLESFSKEELQVKCVIPVSISTIIDNSPDEQANQRLLLKELWKQLTNTASESAVISYGELAKELSKSAKGNIHHKKVIVLLGSITKFCSERNLPHLTYLAINGKSELPEVLKKESNADTKLAEEKTKIYTFNWHTIANPFVDENSDDGITIQATPVLLSKAYSSQEPVVDNSNRNELADEALRLETPVIENSNEISIGSEKNKGLDNMQEVFDKPMSNGLKTISVKERKKYSLNDRLTGKHRNNQEY